MQSMVLVPPFKLVPSCCTRKRRQGGKLDPRWDGPYEITSVLGKGLYSLKSCAGDVAVKRVNGMHLKVFEKVRDTCTHKQVYVPYTACTCNHTKNDLGL